MTTTQDRIPISDITDDLVFLKDGSVTAVLKTSAVNFGLLSDVEQYSIIESFAGLLNSLSFPIQILIRSERMDVSSYLFTLDEALVKQTNPLLRKMIVKYRQFVETMIKENDVLDKQFYVCINVRALELGTFTTNKQDKIKKANTILVPRIDHLSRQLSRTGLKSFQLITDELVELFYTIYNESSVENYSHEQEQVEALLANEPTPTPTPTLNPQPQTLPKQVSQIEQSSLPRSQPKATPEPTLQFNIPRPQSVQQTQPTMPAPPKPIISQPTLPRIPYTAPGSTANLAHPFVVEELKDEYGP